MSNQPSKPDDEGDIPPIPLWVLGFPFIVLYSLGSAIFGSGVMFSATANAVGDTILYTVIYAAGVFAWKRLR